MLPFTRSSRTLTASAVIAAVLLAVPPIPAEEPAVQLPIPPTVFDLADEAGMIAVGRVEEVSRLSLDRLLLYRVRRIEALRGPVPEEFSVPQERFYAMDRPYFEQGDRALLFLGPLGELTYDRSELSGGEYAQTVRGEHGGVVIGDLDGQGMLSVIRRYLEIQQIQDPKKRREASLGFLLGNLGSSVERVRNDSARRLAAFEALQTDLTKEDLEKVFVFLASQRNEIRAREAVIRGLGHQRVERSAPLLEALAEDNRDVDIAAMRALELLGRPRSTKQLRLCANSIRVELRLFAIEGLARAGEEEAEAAKGLERLATADPSPRVRIAAIQAVAGSEHPRRLAILERAMHDPEPQVVFRSGEALRKIGTEEAVEILTRQFESGSYSAQLVAVYALRQLGSPQAAATLADVRANHPDPRIRRLAELVSSEAAGR